MKKHKNLIILIPLIIILILSFTFMIITSSVKQSTSKQYIAFLQDVTNNKISSVFLTNSSSMLIELKTGEHYETDNPRTANLKETLLKAGITVSEQQPTDLIKILPLIAFLISVILLVIFLLKNTKLTSKSMFAVDALDAKEIHKSSFNFDSMAGNEEAKESVKDIVDFLKNPEKYAKYGARMPHGIILHGEPGTGKTLLAKAISGEAQVPFYAVSGSDFIQVYVGVGASRIRQLFKKAKLNGKAVIFIDEIDAIGKKRSNSKGGGADEKDQTLNALLTEMSGFNEHDGIIVLAATNRLDMLDAALLRPGRFDRHIEVTLPDVYAREQILNLHLKNKPLGELNVSRLAQKTVFFSGAKLENLVNEAAILACKENNDYITEDHIDKAFSTVLAGYEKINRSHIKDEDKKITAYHEAGHALISMKLLPEEKIAKITIIPSTKGAGGYTISIPQDKLYQNKSYLKKRIMVLLGGRAAEEIIFGKDNITTGAFSDLKSSTNIITNMISNYGMGDALGLLSLEEIAAMNITVGSAVIEECKALVTSLYEDTKNLLIENREFLEKLTLQLIYNETISEKELNVFVKLN